MRQTEIPEEELNEKLAKWASVAYCKYWNNPGHDSRNCDRPIPGFTQSLDACFQWIIPKLLEDYNIDWYNFKQTSGLYYSEVNVWQAGEKSHRVRVLHDVNVSKHFEQGESLPKITALALCRAMEKLLDLGGAK